MPDDTLPTDGHQSSDANTQGPTAKKRRTNGSTSSRGVANLTPEQLARKRANDREAQRAIRERTKNQIDRLNQRIRELEGQQPYHELQVVLREKDVIQAENEDIKKRLASVLSIIQPILGASGGLNELAAAAAERSVPPPQEPPPPHPYPEDPRPYHNIPEVPPPANAPPVQHSPEGHNGHRQWQFPGDAPTSHVRRWPAPTSPYDPQLPPPRHHEQLEHHEHHEMPFDERLGVDFLLDGTQRRISDGHLPSQGSTPSVVAVIVNPNDQTMLPHNTLPKAMQPTCPLDSVMLDFLAEQRARAAQGVSVKTLAGPLYPNFTALLYSDRHTDSHPLSKLFTDILRTFPDISNLPEQVAVVFIMFLIMRWLIDPSPDNYDRLPDWMTPRASQLFTSHPIWMDNLPWPRLRDRIISANPPVPFDTFFIPFTTTVSVNWPYEPRDCLLPASKVLSTLSSNMSSGSPFSTAVNVSSPVGPPTPTTRSVGGDKTDEAWLINPAFESHLRNLSNWSLGPAFKDAFPGFKDCVRTKEGR